MLTFNLRLHKLICDKFIIEQNFYGIIMTIREGFNKNLKKKYGIFHKGGRVPPNFGSVSILFFIYF